MNSSADTPSPKRCGSYGIGHEVHYIQARLLRESGEGMPCDVKVGPGGWLVVTVQGEKRRLWNRDAERLAHLLEAEGSQARLRAHHGLTLRSHVFSISDERTAYPAPDDHLSGLGPHDGLREHGGS